MNPHRLNIGWCIFAVGLHASASAAAEPPQIDKNPFARPAWEAVVDDRSLIPIDNTTRASMDLRATMVSGKGSLANVSGKIIGVGDSIGRYKLLRVYEDRAVFDHQGKTLTIFVRPPADEDDE
ncbi:MAG: hypothetical protein HKN35_13175 [Woeseia sp.]|nr:hypothetical protein [Gammaproteobacteria bacterium]NNE61840.1 hypothetical protein [Woeseia sp.]